MLDLSTTFARLSLSASFLPVSYKQSNKNLRMIHTVGQDRNVKLSALKGGVKGDLPASYSSMWVLLSTRVT
jgi:hypothetical protein